MSRIARLKTSIEKLERSLVSAHAAKRLPQTSATSALDSWDEFIRHKSLSDWCNEDREIRLSLLTELLSYPLTLATYLQKQLIPSNTGKNGTVVHIIGARAEATLPVVYWAQTLGELEQESLTLRFFGPDIPSKLDKTEDSMNVGSKILKRSFASSLYPSASVLSSSSTSSSHLSSPMHMEIPDLFVMFNPGIAHDKLKKVWRPTIHSIMAANKPILLSGLHLVDVHHDYEQVKAQHPIKCVSPPKINPFASSKEFADGLSGRVARANLYVWDVRD